MSVFKDFGGSMWVTLVGIGIGLAVGGMRGVFIVIVLGLLEVALSFDNAVVNAKVLASMSQVWRRRFLTWGMLIAVFGMRAIFPVLIVAITAGLGMQDVVAMALQDPERYARHLHSAHVAISAFGGAFLAMVFLKWIIDPAKEINWLGFIERPLTRLPMDGVHAVIVLLVLLVLNPVVHGGGFLAAGCAGLAVYLAVDGLGSLFKSDGTTTDVAKAGAASFIYLEVLDASFSFDGVIGAFAVTKDVVIITVGLAIGAMFVRSLTLLLVKRGTLAQYRYLEHGAHYGIGTLAAIMFASLFWTIPEVLAAGLSAALIIASLVSSQIQAES